MTHSTVIVTDPDIYYGHEFKLACVGVDPRDIIEIMGRVDFPLVIHSTTNENYNWTLNACMQSDLILLNMYSHAITEVLQGYLLGLPKTHWYGAEDYRNINSNRLITPVYIVEHIVKNQRRELEV